MLPPFQGSLDSIWPYITIVRGHNLRHATCTRSIDHWAMANRLSWGPKVKDVLVSLDDEPLDWMDSFPAGDNPSSRMVEPGPSFREQRPLLFGSLDVATNCTSHASERTFKNLNKPNGSLVMPARPSPNSLIVVVPAAMTNRIHEYNLIRFP